MNLETDEVLVELIQDATQKALSKLFQEHKEKFYMWKILVNYMTNMELMMENIINRRIFMTKEQINFFEELAYIQEYCVQVPLSKEDKYCNTEELLKDVTYEVIYRIMELLDGYGRELQRCNIVNTVTGEVINEGIELHDKCVEFLENPFIADGFISQHRSKDGNYM